MAMSNADAQFAQQMIQHQQQGADMAAHHATNGDDPAMKAHSANMADQHNVNVQKLHGFLGKKQPAQRPLSERNIPEGTVAGTGGM